MARTPPPKAECPDCKALVAAWAPRGGDGSGRNIRAHAPGSGRWKLGQAMCPGSGRLVDLADLHESR